MFDFNLEKLFDLIRNHGHKVMVAGYNDIEEELKQKLREQYFTIIPEIKHCLYFDVTLFVTDRPGLNREYTLDPAWATTIFCFDPAKSERKDFWLSECLQYWYWNGSEFVFVNNDTHHGFDRNIVSSNEEQHEHFLNTTIQLMPDLEQIRNDIGMIYAGASSDCNISAATFLELTQMVRNHFSNGKTKIIFWNGEETLQTVSLFKCQRVAEHFYEMCPTYTFYYVTSNLDAQYVYDELTKLHKFNVPIIMLPVLRFELQSKEYFSDKRIYGNDLEQFKLPYDDTTQRKTKYINFNRVPRTHRSIMFAECSRRNILENSYTSFDVFENVKATTVEEFINTSYDVEIDTEENKNMMTEEFSKHWNSFPMVINRSKERDNPVDICTDDIRFFRNSYFSLVSETCFYTVPDVDDLSNYTNYWNGVFFSEKLFKPLVYKHPFILLGAYKSLDKLRQMGYETFHPYLDETYDSVEDDNTRLKMVADTVEKLYNTSDDDWLYIMKKIKPIIEHNFNHFLSDKNLSVKTDVLRYFK